MAFNNNNSDHMDLSNPVDLIVLQDRPKASFSCRNSTYKGILCQVITEMNLFNIPNTAVNKCTKLR